MRSAVAAAALVAALLTPTASAPAQEAASRSPFSAFATGTAVHAEVLRGGTGGPTLVGRGGRRPRPPGRCGRVGGVAPGGEGPAGPARRAGGREELRARGGPRG